MKAIVDQDTCISCGACVATCPQVFEFNEDEKAMAKVDEVTKTDEETCKEARDNCPVDAIDIKE